MLLNYALRELRNSPRFCLLFCLNLTLGLTGFIALDAMKRSFSQQLQNSAKNLLAADLAISARRPLTTEEARSIDQILPAASEQQNVLSLYSMVASAKRSVLVELKGIESSFPFYGSLTLQRQGIYTAQSPLSLAGAARIWVGPDLLLQLDAKLGDTLRIGKLDYIIDDVLLDDSSASFVNAALAPRVYLALESLQSSGLLQFGSTVWHTKLFRLPETSAVETMEDALNKVLVDPAIKVSSYTKSGQDNGRMLAYLSDYLGLVSLVAIALAAIGAAYLFRMYLDQKLSAMATLISIGLTHERAMLLYLWQLLILGACSALGSIVLSLGLLPLAEQLLSRLTPLRFVIKLGPSSLLLAVILGTLGAVLVCLPMLLRIRKLNPALLFQEFSAATRLWSASTWLNQLPSLAAFYGLSIWQAHSIQIGSLFCATLLALILIFGFFGWLGLLLLSKRTRQGSLSSRLAISYLRSQPGHSLSSFIALGLSAALINLIPQIQSSIQGELQRPDGDLPPSLFLFDIQEDQVQELEALVKSHEVKPKATAPMIMARLSEINGKAFQKTAEESLTREAEREERSRNRGVNLSYRSYLARSESITQGKFFDGSYREGQAQDSEISLEQRYAERLGVSLGDRLTFDVQGLPVSGVVTSMRSVKWNTFEPNFFILLQPGLLDDAPKTFLMTLPEISRSTKQGLQAKIVESFPNVSIIDVSSLIDKLTSLIGQMSLVLVVMAWLTVATGYAVIFSIAQNQALARRWDINLLKILGADFRELLKATLKEFAILGAGSAVLGSLLGVLASFILAKFLFKGLWQVSLLLPCVMSFTLILLCLITSYFATQKILAEKPVLTIEE